MLSNRLYLFIDGLCHLINWFGVSEFTFSQKEKLFMRNPTAHSRVARNFNLVLLWAFFSLISTIKFYIIGDFSRFNLTLAYWLAGIMVTMAYSISRFFPHDIMMTMNGTISFSQRIQHNFMRNFDPNTNRQNMVFDVVIMGVAVGILLSYTFITALLIYDSSAVIFLGALFPPKYFTLPLKLAVILYHAYLLIVVHVCILTCIEFIMIYGFYVSPILLNELSLPRQGSRVKKNYKTMNSLRSGDNIRIIFRSCQVLQASTLSWIGKYVLLFNGSCMLTSIYCNSVLIRYWKALSSMTKGQLLLWAVMTMGFWTFVLELGKLFYSKGNSLLKTWKAKQKWGSKKNSKVMKAFIRSCTPILISYGRQFVIRKSSLFAFHRGIIRGTVRILLTTKNQ